MAIKIFENPIIHEKCRTNNKYEGHRLPLYKDYSRRHHDSDNEYIEAFKKVVEGKDVVEIGCGVFGGLSSLALVMGCTSYTGVDSSIGDNTRMVDEENIIFGEKNYRKKVPLVITIPEEVKMDSRANFIFGMDFLTYLRDEVKDNNVVTISTGFFDKSVILMPNGQGQDYVLEGMEQIARVTVPGYPVGMHDFFPDVYPSNPEYDDLTAGKFFKENFPRFGIKVIPVFQGSERDNFCLFTKE
jgi:hypothetical protein